MREWLLGQQSTREHPFTHAAPGAWAWTPLSGGVPDADDTSGALLALRRLGDPDVAGHRGSGGRRTLVARGSESRRRRSDVLPRLGHAAVRSQHARDHRARAAGVERLVPAFRSGAAAGRCEARSAAGPDVPRGHASARTARGFRSGSATSTRPTRTIPTYGTARVLLGSAFEPRPRRAASRRMSSARRPWLLEAQNADGGWGGSRAVPSSIEETGVVLAALGRSVADGDERRIGEAVARGARWLSDATSTARRRRRAARPVLCPALVLRRALPAGVRPRGPCKPASVSGFCTGPDCPLRSYETAHSTSAAPHNRPRRAETGGSVAANSSPRIFDNSNIKVRSFRPFGILAFAPSDPGAAFASDVLSPRAVSGVAPLHGGDPTTNTLIPSGVCILSA